MNNVIQWAKPTGVSDGTTKPLAPSVYVISGLVRNTDCCSVRAFLYQMMLATQVLIQALDVFFIRICSKNG